MPIKQFKDLNIKVEQQAFSGEKIKIKKIFNQQIDVHDYRIVPSKFEGIRLDMQISIGDTKHIVFTTSKYLQEAIKQVPKDSFPFRTKIVEIEDRFEFT